jgi:hypothetical protein
MIVCNERKFVFIHNPKAAGTSFRKVIEQYHDHHRRFWGLVQDPFLQAQVDLAHLRSWELAIVAPSLFERLAEFRSLVFVRHPARRFISACFEYFHNFVPEAGFGTLDVDGQRRLIHGLIETTLNHRLVISDARYVHFSPQKWFIFLGVRRIVGHVLPLFSSDEELVSAFDLLELPRVKVPTRNRSATPSFGRLYTPEVASFVDSFYRIDFEYFLATDHLRPLAAKIGPEASG